MSPNFSLCQSKDEISKQEGFTRLYNSHTKNEEVFYVDDTNKSSLLSLHPAKLEAPRKIFSKEALEHISEPCELAFNELKENDQLFFAELESVQ
jgi:hypothetical protein